NVRLLYVRFRGGESMTTKLLRALLALCAAGLSIAASAKAPDRIGADYVFTGDIDAGGPGFWDYATLDAESSRLHVAHVGRVTVIDLKSRTVVGTVAPLSRAHGVVVVPSTGKGYATSGGDGMLKVFGLTDFHITKEIPVGDDADAAIYDPQSASIIVM